MSTQRETIMKRTLLLFAGIFLIQMAAYAFAQANLTNWRWRNDDGNETSATWKTGERTSSVIHSGENVRLRCHIQNTSSQKDWALAGIDIVYSTSSTGP